MDKGENILESRADWIDVLKGIGIILVVIGHVNTKGFLVQWLYTFHMPLFLHYQVTYYTNLERIFLFRNFC